MREISIMRLGIFERDKKCPAIESVLRRLSGAWVFRDTRMPVSAVFENLEAGATIEEIEQFDITRDQIKAVLEFAARSLDPVPATNPRWMLILFDLVTPSGIARFLPGHTVIKAKDRGWDTLTNGELLSEAERAGFDVLLTADKNLFGGGIPVGFNPIPCYFRWKESAYENHTTVQHHSAARHGGGRGE
jgi:uncharacterized protein (DUF433 family)